MTDASPPRWERALLVTVPAAAILAVGTGLRIGSTGGETAAIVQAAPACNAGTGLAWQVLVLDEDSGGRRPAAGRSIEVDARTEETATRWTGRTDDDGVAEVLLPLSVHRPLELDVRSAGITLAKGAAAPAPPGLDRVAPRGAWARFARRSGAIALDVAVLGERGASGFPVDVWVRATDARSHDALAGVAVDLQPDVGVTHAWADGRTDAGGWSHVRLVPLGYAVALVFDARAPDGRTGSWAGALLVSPGGIEISMRDRYGTDEPPVVDVTAPNLRRTAYVEIDDATGRAFGSVVPLAGSEHDLPSGVVRAPRLSPGLYWAIASGDPSGATELGPGTMARPFFVAATDRDALRFGLDASACTAVGPGPGDFGRAVARCLAVAGSSPVPRWTALDGFTARHAMDARRRKSGVRVALGALLAAMALEALLLARLVLRTRRVQARAGEGPGEAWIDAGGPYRVAAAVAVALLGLALLALLLARAP